MSHRRILIVEEQADVRGTLAGALVARGAWVEIAGCREEALLRLRAGAPPAVIVLDVPPPAQGGDDLLRDLRADARYDDVPVITIARGEPPGREPPGEGAARYDLEALLQIVLSFSAPDAA